ncbi:MAG: hypothetical protein ABSH20_24375 [Tepidisphaeraceae bacterium]|jgi:hypothetical protein
MKGRPRAFATITAIILMTVVAVAVLSLAALTAAQAKRTRREVSGGQLKQVLLAATANLSGRLSAGIVFKANDEVVLSLPPQLADVKMTTRIESADGEKVVVMMQVRDDVMRLGQRVTFVRKEARWALSEVQGR